MGYRDLEALLVLKDRRGVLDLVSKGQRENKDLRDHLVLKGIVVKKEILELLGHRDWEVLLVPKERREILGLESMVQREEKDHQGLRDHLVLKGIVDRKEIPELLGHKDLRDHLVLEGTLDRKEILELLGHRDWEALLVLKDRRETVVSLDQWEGKDHQGLRDHVVLKGTQDRKEQLVLVGHKVSPEQREHKDHQGLRDHLVLLGLQEPPVPLACHLDASHLNIILIYLEACHLDIKFLDCRYEHLHL